MSPEAKNVSRELREDAFGSLGSCLVEGNSEQQVRARRLRRRALILSILTQSVVLTLLVLSPLFGKTERIDLTKTVCTWTPPPPYGNHAHHAANQQRTTGVRRHFRDGLFFHPPNPNAPIQQPDNTVTDDELADANPTGTTATDGPSCSGCIEGDPKQPEPPLSVHETPIKPRILKVAQIDPGMLLHRVEPAYPVIAVQIHREGRVELHAIIGTDGYIHSLQVVKGDALFAQSALQAVQQWHYKPTYLNGQAVEVDTYITVVYTLQH